MNIRFTSSLTPEDENAMAPALISALAGLLDLLPIAYAIRIDTSGSKVFQHQGIGGQTTHDLRSDSFGSYARSNRVPEPSKI